MKTPSFGPLTEVTENSPLSEGFRAMGCEAVVLIVSLDAYSGCCSVLWVGPGPFLAPAGLE